MERSGSAVLLRNDRHFDINTEREKCFDVITGRAACEVCSATENLEGATQPQDRSLTD
jgi:hypothetical protein